MKKTYTVFYLLFLLMILGLGVFDITDDYVHGSDLPHLMAEILLVGACVELIRRVWKKYRHQEDEIERLEKEGLELDKSLVNWRKETELLRNTIRESIESQFISWGLSSSEIEVAFLTLRGFSFEQIASLLDKSERTVRKQAGAIYEKSGFSGRAAFVGFFLESLFELDEEPSFYD
jgi:DNA-binding NarL/FixJ family response regulator